MSKLNLGIIGGKGKMGCWLKQQLKSSVNEVLVYDVDQSETLEGFVSACTLIGVSVPISETQTVLNRLKPLVKKEHCVFDLTSIKEFPCQMMSSFPCAAIGMHPLFGPVVQDPACKTIVMCSVRKSKWDEWFEVLWQKKNYRLLQMDPRDHDEKMAWLQAMNPLMHVTLGLSIQKAFSKNMGALMTPSFSLFFQALCRFMKQDPKLYFEMAAYNPYFEKACDQFQQQLSQLKQGIQNREPQVFNEAFQTLQSFIDEEQT